MTLRGKDVWSGHLYMRDYHPYHHGSNPAFTRQDGRTLDFKRGIETALAEGAEELASAVATLQVTSHALLVIVPCHQASPSNAGSSLSRAAAKVAAGLPNQVEPLTDTLIRHTSIERLCQGGNRAIEVHLNSIHVLNPEAVRDRDIVLLDDVATSGNSIAACRRLLIAAGARRVAAVTLGQTVGA